MPRLLDVRTRTQAVTQAVNYLLATRGASALTLRGIGQECRVGASSLSEHYGTREHLLVVAHVTTCRARLERLRERALHEGLLAFLPRDPDEVLDARAWLGWCELERTHDRLHHTLGWARAEDRALVSASLDHRVTRPGLDLVTAAVHGLVVATCAPVEPLPLETARSLLTDVTTSLLARPAA